MKMITTTICFLLFIHRTVASCDITDANFQDYVDDWFTNSTNHPCGEVIGDWDVSNVTDMSYVFCSISSLSKCNTARANFNEDLSGWNTSSVTSLEGTFGGATSFNSDISQWDTSSVTSLYSTFRSATSFNRDISNWDVRNVESLYNVFSYSALEN